MGWTVSTFDNKYQIKYGSNTSYLITEDDVSYLTITDTKHIGINNENPSSQYLATASISIATFISQKT